MLSRKMLFHQGTTGAPVKTPAEDVRLNLAATWTPDGADTLKTRTGVVWGPPPPGVPGPGWTVVTGSGQITVNPCRVVIGGAAATQGYYIGTIDTAQVRTMAQAKTNAGLPASGQFKAGLVVVKVYDQLYDGGSVDGWDVEIYLGAAAATAASAVYPTQTASSLLMQRFTVDSAGNVTFYYGPTWTVPFGQAIPVYSWGGTPATPWEGCRIWNIDTDLESRWNGYVWKITDYHGNADGVPQLSMYQTSVNAANDVDLIVRPSQIRKSGAIDSICSYDQSSGNVTFLASCRVRFDALAVSDSAVERYSHFWVAYPQATSPFLVTAEDQRTVTTPIDFNGSGTMRQAVAMEAEVKAGDVANLYVHSTTSTGITVPYSYWWNITLAT